MTTVRPSTSVDPRRAGVLVGVGAVLLAAAASVAVVLDPVVVGLGLVALLVVAVLVLRLEWTLLGYVAVEPFGDLLGGLVPQGVKVVGLLLFAAWLVRVVLDRRPVALRHPVVVAAGLFATVLLAAFTFAPNGSAGLEVTARYVSYLAVLVVLVDTMRTTVAPRRVATVFLASATVAAGTGLAAFLVAGGRAGGPMEDPNDFAFYLVCALPFALLLWRDGGGPRRWLAGAAAVLLVVTIVATFSRGGLLAVAVMAALALALRLLRARDVVVAAAAVLVGLGAVVATVPELVERSVAEKEFVAQANVESRFTSWSIAARVTADHPLLGVGPGGYRAAHVEYDLGRSADPTHLGVVHQMYLDVASELGLLGLAAFLGMLAAGATAAWRGRAASAPDPGLATAVCVALAGTLVAATFLSEQYYLPIWLLLALGVALDPGRPDRARRGPVPAPDAWRS